MTEKKKEEEKEFGNELPELGQQLPPLLRRKLMQHLLPVAPILRGGRKGGRGEDRCSTDNYYVHTEKSFRNLYCTIINLLFKIRVKMSRVSSITITS